MTTIHIRAFPPSANSLYANVPGKGRVKTERYRTWATAAGWDVKAQKPAKITGRYAITLTVQRKDNRRRDLSNLIKAVSDLLVDQQVIEDDSLEEEVHLYWYRAVEGCVVEIVPIDQRRAAV